MLPFLALVLACKDEPLPTDSVSCDPAPAAADLRVSDERGGPLYYPRTYVRDETGAESPCVDVEEGRWSCAEGARGALTVVVSYPGFETVETPLPLDEDGCRAGGEALDIVLPYAGEHYVESRIFYVQHIPDPYECEHSWELYGMNCYSTLELCPFGYGELILTDIVNGSSYDSAGEAFTLTLLPGAEGRGEVLFAPQSDGTWLDDWVGYRWTEDTAGLFPTTICE